nr:hypothetical protein KV8917_910012 [Klebsiella variicola]
MMCKHIIIVVKQTYMEKIQFFVVYTPGSVTVDFLNFGLILKSVV